MSSTEELELPRLKIGQHVITVELGDLTLGLTLKDDGRKIGTLQPGIWESRLESLAAVPTHAEAGVGLRRYRFVNAPYHSALHIIDDAGQTESDYCELHEHEDCAELNVIVPSEAGLAYEVRDGTQLHTIDEPVALWFPPSVPHCAIAQEGSGLFFVARFPMDSSV
jgi:hypothetical protein